MRKRLTIVAWSLFLGGPLLYWLGVLSLEMLSLSAFALAVIAYSNHELLKLRFDRLEQTLLQKGILKTSEIIVDDDLRETVEAFERVAGPGPVSESDSDDERLGDESRAWLKKHLRRSGSDDKRRPS